MPALGKHTANLAVSRADKNENYCLVEPIILNVTLKNTKWRSSKTRMSTQPISKLDPYEASFASHNTK